MKNYLNIVDEKISPSGVIYYLISFMAITLFIAIIIFSQGKDKAQAAPASSIRFEPATLTVTTDQTFSLEAKINPGSNQLSAVEIHAAFDATKFQMTGASASSAFSVVLQQGQFDNSAGTASIIVGIPTPQAGSQPNYVTSDSTVATFTLRAIGQNTNGSISFTPQTIAAAANESGDVIINRIPAQITIGRKYTNADFEILASDWLQEKSSDADVNKDLKVNTQDLGIMMSNWGN